MANTASITIRVEPTLKKNFDKLCDDFGISVSSAFNIFMKAVVRERRIPFEIQSENNVLVREKGKNALAQMRKIIAESGQSEMTLEEINEFIKQVRDESRK